MNEWLPMSTAPRDGRAVRVKLSTGTVTEADFCGVWSFLLLDHEDIDAEMIGWQPMEPREPIRPGPIDYRTPDTLPGDDIPL